MGLIFLLNNIIFGKNIVKPLPHILLISNNLKNWIIIRIV